MSLSSLFVGNFKGIKEDAWIDIKPITLFIGRNSSGKSSCIHALTALSQTIKLSNNNRPLILDDEYASVHLGRFIEVIHTRSYDDTINIGVKTNKFTVHEISEGKPVRKYVTGEAVYKFKCTKRTQEVLLESINATVGDKQYEVTRCKGQSYTITESGGNSIDKCSIINGFFLDHMTLFITGSHEKYNLFNLFFALQSEIQQQLQNVYYLGPFRQAPIRRYPTRGASPNEVGPQGESTATLLANEFIQSRSRKHILQIAEWLSTMELAQKVDVSRVGSSDLFEVNITLQDGQNFPLADLGYGLSQILPVLTQCSFAADNSVLLFEQPEIHLHPKSAKHLANIFIDTHKKKNVKIIAETHSIELLSQLQCEIRSGNIKSSDVAAYLVKREDKKTKLVNIDIESDGDIYLDWRRELSGI